MQIQYKYLENKYISNAVVCQKNSSCSFLFFITCPKSNKLLHKEKKKDFIIAFFKQNDKIFKNMI